MKYPLLILMTAITLTGCAPTTMQCEPLTLPESLMEPCLGAVEIEGSHFEADIENIKRLTECRIRHESLIEAVR